MSRHNAENFEITPQLLLRAYAAGLFPMAESAEDPTIHWVEPEERGVIPLNGFHVPRSLKKAVRSGRFVIRVDTAFEHVMEWCAKSRPGRETTWINPTILRLYGELHKMGRAHSVECWMIDAEANRAELVGGLYGVRLGAAFFGESMFSLEPDASKVALVHLVARLKLGGFQLLDTQFTTDHLKRFGAVDVPQAKYQEMLTDALSTEANFYPIELAAEQGPLSDQDGGGTTSEVCLQSVSQIS